MFCSRSINQATTTWRVPAADAANLCHRSEKWRFSAIMAIYLSNSRFGQAQVQVNSACVSMCFLPGRYREKSFQRKGKWHKRSERGHATEGTPDQRPQIYGRVAQTADLLLSLQGFHLVRTTFQPFMYYIVFLYCRFCIRIIHCLVV